MATAGLAARSSAIWSTASTRAFCSTTSVVAEPFVDLARQHDIDAIARQHEAADAFHVVDADGHRLHARLHQRRQRRALAGAGDLEREHRLVRLDRGEHHAACRRATRR